MVPILFEATIDNMSNGETALQAATQFNANFIFRGTFQWGMKGVQAGPESSSSVFMKTSDSIKSLKQSNSHLIYEGGFGAQFLADNDTWVNGTALSNASFNDMAGKNASGGWVPLAGYPGYIPDLASQTFRTFVVQWSERQIDEGVDGMLYDDPYAYAMYLVNVEHQNATVVYNQYAGYMNSVVQALKSYASAHGKTFFATFNSARCDTIQGQLQYPAVFSLVSYVTCSPDAQDFNATSNPSLEPVENFGRIKAAISAVVDLPIMVFIDWPTQQWALANLTAQQQMTALTNLDYQLKSSGMPFVYEVYHSPHYDSVSEGTYSTLLQLAKAGGGSTSTSLGASPLLATQSPGISVSSGSSLPPITRYYHYVSISSVRKVFLAT